MSAASTEHGAAVQPEREGDVVKSEFWDDGGRKSDPTDRTAKPRGPLPDVGMPA